MITAIDANVLLDLLVGKKDEIEVAEAALRLCNAQGSICISSVAYAEVAGRFPDKTAADEFFQLLGCAVDSLDESTAFLAARLAREYRSRGGKRTRILPDFLIAAHALIHANRFLTRDKRFFAHTFPEVNAIHPGDLS